jgi:nitroreductase
MNRRAFLWGGGALAAAGLGGVAVERHRMGSLDNYAAAQARLREALAQRPDLPDLIRFATLAPSGHNTQPWRFAPDRDAISILPDFTRRTPAVDPDDHHLFVSLGCAAETLDLAARHGRQGGELAFDPADQGRLTYRFGSKGEAAPDLFGAVVRRQSTRAPFDGRKADSETLRRLSVSAAIDGVDLVLITDPAVMTRFADLIVEGNSAQMADPRFVRELRQWLRFNPRAALAKGDGLFSASSGNPQLPTWLGPALFDLTFRAGPENDKYRAQIASSAGLAIFSAQLPDRAGWIAAGRACQRFALAATAQGLKLSFVNQPVEVPGLRARCAELAGMPGRRPDLVMRFGYGAFLPYSSRRPVSAVLV